MKPIQYTALIRTFNSERTLPVTLESLARQSLPPSEYVFVDSGSADSTLSLLPPASKIHLYTQEKFNYSISLNEGIEFVNTEYTLIISSHTSLKNDTAMEFAINLLNAEDDIGAAYFVEELSSVLKFERINQKNFTGFNGVWNTCGLYKTCLLKKRLFRPEVYSAEDQEWSRWLFHSHGKSIARVSGAGMTYDNPAKYPIRKRLNEEVAVALYAKEDMLTLPYLLRVCYRIVRPFSKKRERIFNCVLLVNLLYHKLRLRQLRT